MATLILSDLTNVQKLYGEFNDFITKNGVLAVSVGVIIGIATTGFLREATYSVLLPLLDFLLLGTFKVFLPRTAKAIGDVLFSHHDGFMWRRFTSELVTWCVMLFAAFLLIKLVIMRIPPGVDTSSGQK